MFGLTFDKLIVIGIIAVVVIGPQRLPEYAERLARLARTVRDVCETARRRTEAELGVPIEPTDWQAQVQQYDPRRIIREALQDADSPGPQPVVDQSPPASTDADASSERPAEASRAGWIVAGGSSGHPRRVRAARPRTIPDRQADASLQEPEPAAQQTNRDIAVQSPEPEAASAAASLTG